MPAGEKVKRREVKEVEGWAAGSVRSGGKKFVTSYDANIWRPALAKFIQIFINQDPASQRRVSAAETALLMVSAESVAFCFGKKHTKHVYIHCEQNTELLIVNLVLKSQKECNCCL
jgi:hypothetical protein